jgi:hypothetical protein
MSPQLRRRGATSDARADPAALAATAAGAGAGRGVLPLPLPLASRAARGCCIVAGACPELGAARFDGGVDGCGDGLATGPGGVILGTGSVAAIAGITTLGALLGWPSGGGMLGAAVRAGVIAFAISLSRAASARGSMRPSGWIFCVGATRT